MPSSSLFLKYLCQKYLQYKNNQRISIPKQNSIFKALSGCCRKIFIKKEAQIHQPTTKNYLFNINGFIISYTRQMYSQHPYNGAQNIIFWWNTLLDVWNILISREMKRKANKNEMLMYAKLFAYFTHSAYITAFFERLMCETRRSRSASFSDHE